MYCTLLTTSNHFCLLRFPLRRSKSSESHDGEKKKSKGGFLNLIKRSSKSEKADKSDKSEKNQATPPVSGKSEKTQATNPASGSSSATAAPTPASIPEEPSSPKVSVKSPAPEPKSRYDYCPPVCLNVPVGTRFTNRSCRPCRDASSRSQPTDYSSSSDRSEELRTPDSMDEPWECSDGRGSPQGSRRYQGMQMMGSGLLAEMKAKQERRAHKVRWCDFKKKQKIKEV